MYKRIIVVGDIHAHINILNLLNTIDLTKEDLIIQMGDFLDRGGEHEEVCKRLDYLCKHYKTIILLGNHELFYLQKDYFHIIYNNRLSALKEFYKKEYNKNLRMTNYDSFSLISGLIRGNKRETRLVKLMVKYAKHYRRLLLRWIKKGRIQLAYAGFGYLFTHAGITNDLLMQSGWKGLSIENLAKNLNALFTKSLKEKEFEHPIFDTVWTRSAISNDFPQVVGHTPQEEVFLAFGRHLYVDNGLFVKEDQTKDERKKIIKLFEPDIVFLYPDGSIKSLRLGTIRDRRVRAPMPPQKYTKHAE